MWQRMKRPLFMLSAFLVTAIVVMGASECEGNTSAKSDETVCVFDGSERGAQKLKYQLLPGENPRDSDSNDEVVRIPASFRFYAAFRDRSIADAGAPEFYVGYAKGNVPIQAEGQAKFRFNLDNACDWYAKHGRRNVQDGSLGFNARNDENASALSPWVRWLNENFGTVMAATIKTNSTAFTWPQLVYGNDSEVKRTSNEPMDVTYGKVIGRAFTARLRESLGGNFFCGTDPALWDDYNIDSNCPPIYFEPGAIVTADAELMKAREATETLRAQLENAETEARIKAQQVASQIRAQNTEQRLLREQVQTAKLKAQAAENYQRCIVYARLGLDCAGRRPGVYTIQSPPLNGTQTTPDGG